MSILPENSQKFDSSEDVLDFSDESNQGINILYKIFLQRILTSVSNCLYVLLLDDIFSASTTTGFISRTGRTHRAVPNTERLSKFFF